MAWGSRAIFRFPYFWPLGWKQLARAAKACILGGLPALLAGCSMAFPMSPLMWPGSKEDAAGAVPKSPLAGLLDSEDLPRQGCAFDRPRSARQWFAGRLG
jgi:hypothetical protein